MSSLTDEDVNALRELAHELRGYRASEAQGPAERRADASKVSANVAMSPGGGMEEPGMKPRLGEVVVYRALTRGYELPAIVTANVETLDRRGVIRGDVPDITGEENVHLNVQTCGAQVAYQEFDIPFSRDPIPGTWAWR